jgi:hypothetical protein
MLKVLSIVGVTILMVNGCGGEGASVVNNPDRKPAGVQKTQIATKSPLSILQQRVDGRISSFTYTPQEKEAAVVVESEGVREIYMYDISDKSNPKQKYYIYGTDDDATITNVKMIGDRRLSFVIEEHYSDDSQKIVYDYVNHKIVSKSYIQTPSLIEKIVKNQIEKDGYVLNEYVHSYNGDGIIALASKKDGAISHMVGTHTLYIFGMINEIPMYEKRYKNFYFPVDYMGRLKALPGGKVQIYQSDMGESSYIVFDYINGELL